MFLDMLFQGEKNYFSGESDTSGTVDTSVHPGLNQGAQIFVFDGSFIFHVSALSVSVDLRNILEIALTTLFS